MNLPIGSELVSELVLVGAAAFVICLGILSAVSRRVHPASYDELEQSGAINGIRLRRTAARRR